MVDGVLFRINRVGCSQETLGNPSIRRPRDRRTGNVETDRSNNSGYCEMPIGIPAGDEFMHRVPGRVCGDVSQIGLILSQREDRLRGCRVQQAVVQKLAGRKDLRHGDGFAIQNVVHHLLRRGEDIVRPPGSVRFVS